jgi:hypothetical protein
MTQQPSGGQTPLTKDIFLRKKIAKGGFGAVTHYWNVSSGKQHAEKRALWMPGGIHYELWQQEADIMSKLSHVSSTLYPSFQEEVTLTL